MVIPHIHEGTKDSKAWWPVINPYVIFYYLLDKSDNGFWMTFSGEPQQEMLIHSMVSFHLFLYNFMGWQYFLTFAVHVGLHRSNNIERWSCLVVEMLSSIFWKNELDKPVDVVNVAKIPWEIFPWNFYMKVLRGLLLVAKKLFLYSSQRSTYIHKEEVRVKSSW